MRSRIRCASCGVFHNAKQDHTCIVYDGPQCTTEGCNEPTTFVHMGAPCVGSGYVCKANHYDGDCRELTLAEVI